MAKKLFEKVVHQNNVYLTKEELNSLFSRFSNINNDTLIDYARLSREMGLQSNTLNLVNQTHKFLNQIHQHSLNNSVAAIPQRSLSTAASAISV